MVIMGPMTVGPMTKGGHQARPYRCFRGCLGCRPLVVPGFQGTLEGTLGPPLEVKSRGESQRSHQRRLFDSSSNWWMVGEYAIIFCSERRVVTHTQVKHLSWADERGWNPPTISDWWLMFHVEGYWCFELLLGRNSRIVGSDPISWNVTFHDNFGWYLGLSEIRVPQCQYPMVYHHLPS